MVVTQEFLDGSLMKIEPPNNDVFHVRKDLKEILACFNKYQTLSSDDPFIKKKLHEINKQGLEFHSCLQKSVTQSNQLENHAENVINYIEILEDPIFDSTRVLDILKNLSENTRKNKEEAQQIKDKYNEIKEKLSMIDDELITHDIENERKLRSLQDKKEELKDLEDLNNRNGVIAGMILIGMIFMFGLLICDINVATPYQNYDKRIVINIGYIRDLFWWFIFIMIIIAITSLFFRYVNNNQIKIKKIKKEIRDIQNLELKNAILLRKNIDIGKLCENIHPIIIQMGAFNTYWETQYHILDDLNRNLRNEGDNLQKKDKDQNTMTGFNQSRKVLIGPIKIRWEQVKIQSSNYTKTVRNILKA